MSTIWPRITVAGRGRASASEFARFALPYQFAISMLTTKVSILKEKLHSRRSLLSDRGGHLPGEDLRQHPG